ncbi:hypothetical protein DU508_17530 [Pedobacter chinensis]|uniref:Uncharacterized protein n=1 Tax=Pedobacter chinensis TaxID=2282421 RepID=A0A369PS71_9SPHI|nr:hypothetical protein [Pedobacter chinensis]RDC55374.1 hypothetical protein DU508_17530 [Pedobacter chinensis]
MVTHIRFFYFAIIHFLFLATIAVISTISSYEKSSSFVENDFTTGLTATKEGLQHSISIPLVKQYLSLSGIDAGYGFFAPNVASSYVLKITILDRKTRQEMVEHFSPPFRTKEGKNKYHTLLGSFQDRLTIIENERLKKKSVSFKESKKYGEYLDIYLKSIGRFYYNQYKPDKFLVHCTLFLYHYPSLNASVLEKKAPLLIKLLELDAKHITLGKN